MDRVEQYHRAAEECRQMAQRSHVPKHEERWLRLADRWQAMALEAEEMSRSVPIAPEPPPASSPSKFLVANLLSELSEAERLEMAGLR